MYEGIKLLFYEIEIKFMLKTKFAYKKYDTLCFTYFSIIIN